MFLSQTNRRVVGIALGILAGNLLLGCGGPQANGGASSSGNQVDEQLLLDYLADNNTVALIDARSPGEYSSQHIPGAVNLPYDELDEHKALLPSKKDKPIVIYCRSGKRAGILGKDLKALGYSEVHVLPREQIFWNDEMMVLNASLKE